MATQAHAAYCLETLAADLEDRSVLSFQRVQELWAQYDASLRSQQLQATAGLSYGPDQYEVEHGESSGNAEGSGGRMLDDEDEDEDELDEEILDQTQPKLTPKHDAVAQAPVRSTLQLPSISRLQALSPASGSSSSSASTSSSSAALGGNSRSSSNSSFFSFGRSKQPSPAIPKVESYPLFVTWNTVSRRSGNKSLRGCIGTFDQKEISGGLGEYALIAAFKDNRFPPIGLSELPTLSCSVTLLTNFTTGSSPFDWIVGVHGIRISFHYGHQRIGATYLPDVMPEQGWSQEEALVSLMRKAGWSGRTRDWREAFEKGKGTLVRYEGRKATLDWDEWDRWRQWTRHMGYN